MSYRGPPAPAKISVAIGSDGVASREAASDGAMLQGRARCLTGHQRTPPHAQRNLIELGRFLFIVYVIGCLTFVQVALVMFRCGVVLGIEERAQHYFRACPNPPQRHSRGSSEALGPPGGLGVEGFWVGLRRVGGSICLLWAISGIHGLFGPLLATCGPLCWACLGVLGRCLGYVGVF